jgi:DNA recombination protein RmuC
MEYLIVATCLINLVLIGLFFVKNGGKKSQLTQELRDFFREEFRDNRTELNQSLSTNREENNKSIDRLTKQLETKLNHINDGMLKSSKESREEIKFAIREFNDAFQKSIETFTKAQELKFDAMAEKQDKLVESTGKELDKMRETVDEKLQKTLNERLSKSFEQVGRQLGDVQKGLGEMQNLAQDVGGLKRVLSNVKMRGGFGEIQLSMLLENLLAPDQYESNVKTKNGSDAIVEFAVKLPGSDESGDMVWLPIDAKFPKDAYEQLQDAYDKTESTEIEAAQKNLEQTIKKMAKDISEKYLDPPYTTDFGIMFLPFEGIYAEVIRKAALLEDIQREYRVVVTGPATLGAILNSLQMGFRTLAIQKRSSEVWKILGSVKTEFNKFGGILEKAQRNIQTGLNHLDQVSGTRTRAIQRTLREVTELDQPGESLIEESDETQNDVE